MRMLISRGSPTLLPMQGGQFGHGQGSGLGRGFLRRTNDEPEKQDRGYKPPGRGCGVNAVSVVAFAIAVGIPLLSRLSWSLPTASPQGPW
jgi:hypothetical protein